MSNNDVLKKQIASARGRVTEALKAAGSIQDEAEKCVDSIRRLRVEADTLADSGDVSKVAAVEGQIAAHERIMKRQHPRWHMASVNVSQMRGELARLELQQATAERQAAQSDVDQAMATLETLRRRLGETIAVQEKQERAIEQGQPDGPIRKLSGSPKQIAKAAQSPEVTISRLELATVLDTWNAGIGLPKRYPSKCLVYYEAETGQIIQPPIVFLTTSRPDGDDETSANANAERHTFSEREFLSVAMARR